MSNWIAFVQRKGLSKASDYKVQASASEQEIMKLESRLVATLPPSYKSFLFYSNGWNGYLNSHVKKLLSTQEIAWFRESHQDWIDSWYEGEKYIEMRYGPPDPVDDAEYLAYSGDTTYTFRSEYLPNLLTISAEYDGAILLLNPKVVTGEGEWEAWFFANWLAGARR